MGKTNNVRKKPGTRETNVMKRSLLGRFHSIFSKIRIIYHAYINSLIRKKNVKGVLMVSHLDTASMTMVGTSRLKHWNKESCNYILKRYREQKSPVVRCFCPPLFLPLLGPKEITQRSTSVINGLAH